MAVLLERHSGQPDDDKSSPTGLRTRMIPRLGNLGIFVRRPEPGLRHVEGAPVGCAYLSCPMSGDELKVLLGALLRMVLGRQPEIAECWMHSEGIP